MHTIILLRNADGFKFEVLVRQRTDGEIFFAYLDSHSDLFIQEKCMKSFITMSTLLLISTSLIGGCASNSPYQTSTPYSTPYPAPHSSSSQSRYSNVGVIESIYVTRSETQNSGAGAVVGGLVGGLLGNQIGSGNGRTAATVAGVVGGAVVGNNVEKNRTSASSELYEIRVRMDNGDSVNIVQDSVVNLRIGDRIRVVDGRVYLY